MSVVFDGHDLSLLGIVGDPHMTILAAQPTYADSRNRDGAAFIGSKWGPSTVVFTLAVLGTARERRDKLSALGAWLDVDEPKKLVLPDTPDRYYMAVPDGSAEIDRYVDADVTQLTFTLTDPVAYGVTRSVTVPSGGSATFVVGGTAPAKPRITCEAATRDPASLVWGIRLDDGDYVHVATGSDSARNVSLDCDGRTCVVGTDVTVITPYSDWLAMEKGEHTLAMDNGTGAAVVEYEERWY